LQRNFQTSKKATSWGQEPNDLGHQDYRENTMKFGNS